MDPFSRSRDGAPQPPPIAFATQNQPAPDVSRYPPDPQPDLDRSDSNIAFMKGPKRKRLAKVHFHLLSPSTPSLFTRHAMLVTKVNGVVTERPQTTLSSYFASKKCTYTDASGKPVPAPRPLNSDRAESSSDAHGGPHPPHPDAMSIGSPSFNVISIQANDVPLSTPSSDDDRASNPRTKRLRPNLGNTSTPSATPPRSLAPPLTQHDRTIERDQALTRELVHLFFAYRQPQRMIIHQPSFLTALSHGTVPQHLLLAVCAVAAPLSKQPRLKTSPCRYAGEMFAQEAVSLMFDKNYQLVCEHSLATAQALLLLQLHDRMGKSLWFGQHYQLALEIVTKIGIFDSDSTVLTPHPTPELIDACIERECARRVFWLIYISDCFGWMLYRRVRLATDSQMNLRLPIDETSFEISPLTAIPEFMTKPNPPYSMCSESGQLIRVLSLHEEAERFLDDLDDCESERYPVDQLQGLETRVGAWADVLPEHMRFTDDNLSVHIAQYDTASNTGAWCFLIMHVIHCSSMLALNLGRQRCRLEIHFHPTWAQERIIKIIEALGRKAKLSIILGVAIWPLFKYADEPPSQTLLNWSSDFEGIWGVRIQDLSRRQLGHGQQLRAQLAPPPPMPPLPTAHVHTSISPVSRAGSDVSPSLAILPPNYIPQGRMPHDTLFHSLPSSSHPETRIQIAHDSREKEVRSVVNDADIDPALQAVPNARLQTVPQLPAPAPPAPSLPSLKASGLLEWPHPGSTDAVVAPSTMQPGVNWQPPTQYLAPSRQPQRDSVRSFSVQSTPDGPRPPAPLATSGMPVGLQWLAHESSVSKPS
ncbi:hypothetical protein J3R82DRAFT_2437 [Butyriboletus roseoflavus]|nr:hypothetical protein J3R82DRAFT_2437 [Butyriboletus roseoflavus]